ncbi:MAG TPA: hypothetical protein VN253_13735 [Kofleriaceae bacterium]|nr:hypothetical protein [Kofleriaceae bacterium]
MTRRILVHAVVFAAVVVLAGGVASAEMSKGVIAAFKGQIVISKADLPEGKSDKESITKIKAAQVKELEGHDNGEVTAWSFHYAAFLNKAGGSSLKLEFWRDGKQYSADKRLEGVDPKSAVLTGEISIDEDENIAKGKSYVIKLVAGKDTVLATTTLVMK